MPSNDLARIQRKLKALPKKAEDTIRKALEKSANEIVDMARRLCPVEHGTLRDSIGWTWGDPPKGTRLVAQSREDSDLRISVYCGGGDAFHAWFVEFGTRYMSAQPFFFPAYRTNKTRAARRTKRAIKTAVREILNGH